MTENDDDDDNDNILHPKILNNTHLRLYIVIPNQLHHCCRYKYDVCMASSEWPKESSVAYHTPWYSRDEIFVILAFNKYHRWVRMDPRA